MQASKPLSQDVFFTPVLRCHPESTLCVLGESTHSRHIVESLKPAELLRQEYTPRTNVGDKLR